jgi:hypothetical protein
MTQQTNRIEWAEMRATATVDHTSTKSEEIAHYEAFLKTLGEGTYLHAMFSRTGGAVANEIRNDFACGPVADVIRERDAARAERLMEEARKEQIRLDAAALALDVASLEKRKRLLEREICELKERAQTILRM